MFVEDWPSINWGVVDYWRQPKPGYEALRTAYQPILPSIEWIKETYQADESAALGLWAINDSWQDYPQAQYLVAVLRDGKVIDRKVINLDIAKDSGGKLEDLRIEHLTTGGYEVQVKIVSAQGKVLGQNQHKFNVLPN